MNKNNTLFLITSIIVLTLVDQLSKVVVRNGFGNLNVISNTGTIFGLLKGSQIYLILLSLALIVFMLWFYFKAANSGYRKAGVVFIISGALGNTIDRVLNDAVTDFISIPFWPSFNFADSFLFIGTILIIAPLLPILKERLN
jgi:signal peptidase II